MSATTKKEINALKDKAHKDLAYWELQEPTKEAHEEIEAIQWYLQDLDGRYPEFVNSYQKPEMFDPKIEKKVVNELKDALHLKLDYWRTHPDAPNRDERVHAILRELAGYELCYPQYKAGYKTPKQRRDEMINCVLLVLVVPFLIWLGTPSSQNTPDLTSGQQQTVDVAQ
jgi:hypothetical protein